MEVITGFEQDGEQFKNIPGYDGKYKVSTFGRVLSYVRKQPTIRKPDCCALYQRIELTGGKKESIHRLVALTFIENPHNYPDVDHIDGNRDNNNVENLRWVSKVQNQQNRPKKILYIETKNRTLTNGSLSIRYPVRTKSENGNKGFYRTFHTREEAQTFIDNYEGPTLREYGENITNEYINLEKDTSNIVMDVKTDHKFMCKICNGVDYTKPSKHKKHISTFRHQQALNKNNEELNNETKYQRYNNANVIICEICEGRDNKKPSSHAKHLKTKRHTEALKRIED